jgi:hypothetical protein
VATITLVETTDATRQVILPVTPRELQESGAAEKRSFSVIGSGQHSRPVGRNEASFPIQGTLPGPDRQQLPHVHDWVAPQLIINQFKDWLNRTAELRIMTDSIVGYDEHHVYVDSYRFIRTGNKGDVSYEVALTEWRSLRIRVDDGSDSSPDANASETASEEEAAPVPQTYTVQSGDTLGAIAKALLGDSSRWREIYDANKASPGDPNNIDDPARIFPGQMFNIPGGTTPADDVAEDQQK